MACGQIVDRMNVPCCHADTRTSHHTLEHAGPCSSKFDRRRQVQPTSPGFTWSQLVVLNMARCSSHRVVDAVTHRLILGDQLLVDIRDYEEPADKTDTSSESRISES